MPVKSPAPAVRKIFGDVEPTVPGPKKAWPNRFNWASVAPVEPKSSSNATPAQKVPDGSVKSLGTKLSRKELLGSRFVARYWCAPMKVRGEPLNPSARQKPMRARAVTAVALKLAAVKTTWLTVRPAWAGSGVMSSITMCVIRLPPTSVAPPFRYAAPRDWVTLS